MALASQTVTIANNNWNDVLVTYTQFLSKKVVIQNQGSSPIYVLPSNATQPSANTSKAGLSLNTGQVIPPVTFGASDNCWVRGKVGTVFVIQEIS